MGRITINGMTFDDYDAERDPSGDIGHALADAELARVGGDFRALGRGEGRDSRDNKNYVSFLREATELGVPTDRLGEWAGTKRRLLQTYFPQFREGGSQPLREYSPAQVGIIFRRIAEQARKLARQ